MIRIIPFADENEIFVRKESVSSVTDAVADIINNVRTRGDEAVFEYCRRFDGCSPDALEIGLDVAKKAFDTLDAEFASVLEKSAANIREYHKNIFHKGFEIKKENGAVLGKRITPLKRVGIYVPGGTAAYPSSVLMNCIPAKIAGVEEVIMVTPPSKSGGVNVDILAAAYVAGVDRIFGIGGAQAVAALAYGTESVPRVDKIVGPGNAFVAEAKRQVFGAVDIDMIAGPSEILVIADSTAVPAYIAADMLSQAEHDKNASAVLITDSRAVANEVSAEIELQLEKLPRYEIARESIDKNGKIIIVDDISTAVEVSNRIAPEHLEICTADPMGLFGRVTNAGSVFLGSYCPEAVGDYYAGTNHVLPTGGTARFSSALSADDFVKSTEYTYYTREALLAERSDIALFASREGLDAHKNSVLIRR